MIREYEPDGCLAAVLASLSFEDAVVLFNGPGGCYNMIAGTANRYIPRNPGSSVDNRMECLYIEDEDFIFGTSRKVERALDSVKDSGYGLEVLVDSPGVSVTGDVGWNYRSRSESPLLHVETPMSSKDFVEGYDRTVAKIIGVSEADGKTTDDRKSINLLGCCPSFIGWSASVEELRGLLSLVGIDVATTPGCGGRFEGLRHAVDADLNVPVVPEYCIRSCRAIEDLGGPGTLDCSTVPIGYNGMNEWITAICDELSVDPEPALDRISSCRRRLSAAIRSSYYRNEFEAKSFRIESVPSLESSLSAWLEDYLGMVATDEVLPDFVYGNDYSARRLSDRESDTTFIPLEFLPHSRTFFIPRTVFGPSGASYIVEETYNGLRSYPPVISWDGAVDQHVRTSGVAYDLAVYAVDLLEHPLIDYLAWSADGIYLPGFVQHDNLIRIPGGDVQVMADHQDDLGGAGREGLEHLRHIDLVADVQV